MKKNTNYSFISFILCFLLTFTSSCSNLSAIFDKNTIANPIFSNSNNTPSNSDNDIQKILNSEYKKFSTKAGEPAGTSITLSKRYVLSTKTVTTYQPSDNDSQGQPPNRIKITTIVKTADVSGGVDFTIDGVVTFNVPAGIGTFGAITVTDVDATFRKYEFLWDGKYTNGNLVEDGIYTIHALKISGTKTLFLDTEIQVTSDPLLAAGLEFYEPQQFTDLSNLVAQIKAPEETANALYDTVNEIEILNKKLVSLNVRVPVDTVKVAEVQQQLTDATTRKTTLESSLTSSINDLVAKKDSLRAFVNTITKNSTFSVDYPITSKPLYLASYDELSYISDIHFSNKINSFHLYKSDDPTKPLLGENPNENTNYSEKIKANDVLDLLNVISDEIQIFKDLNSDYKLGNFNNSGINSNSENKNASRVLSEISTQIGFHKLLLKTFLKKITSDLERKYNALLQDVKDLHYSVQVPIALALQEEPNMQNNPYVIQALKPLPEKFTIKSLTEWATTFNGLIQTFNSYDPLSPVKIRAIRYVMHFDQAQWDALPQENKDELIQSFSDVVSNIVPTTPKEVVENLIAGGIFKVLGKVSKASINLFKKKGTTPAGVLDELADINKNIRKQEKKVTKNTNNISTVCPLKKGLKISNTCTSFVSDEKLQNLVDYIEEGNAVGQRFKGQRRPITDFNSGTKTYQQRIITSKNNIDNIYNDMPNGAIGSIEESLKNKFNTDVRQKVDKFLSGAPNGGIEYDLHGFPNFDEYSIVNIKMPTGTKFVKRDIDFPVINQEFIDKNFNPITQTWEAPFKDLIPDNIKTKEAFEEWRLKFGLTWHHHQDLQTMQLIPREIHRRAGHLGGDSIQRQINVFENNITIYNDLLQQYKNKHGF